MRGLNILTVLVIILAPVLLAVSIDTEARHVKKCTSKSRCKGGVCPEYLMKGFICYNDGSCTAEDVNYCQTCKNSNVYEIIRSEKCPSSIKVRGITSCEAALAASVIKRMWKSNNHREFKIRNQFVVISY
jgi:hypothetical protein